MFSNTMVDAHVSRYLTHPQYVFPRPYTTLSLISCFTDLFSHVFCWLLLIFWPLYRAMMLTAWHCLCSFPVTPFTLIPLVILCALQQFIILFQDRFHPWTVELHISNYIFASLFGCLIGGSHLTYLNPILYLPPWSVPLCYLPAVSDNSALVVAQVKYLRVISTPLLAYIQDTAFSHHVPSYHLDSICHWMMSKKFTSKRLQEPQLTQDRL